MTIGMLQSEVVYTYAHALVLSVLSTQKWHVST